MITKMKKTKMIKEHNNYIKLIIILKRQPTQGLIITIN